MMYPGCGSKMAVNWSDSFMRQWSLGLIGCTTDDLLIAASSLGLNAEVNYLPSMWNQMQIAGNASTAEDTQENCGGLLNTFRYATPNSPGDRAGGFICTCTGWWAPARFKCVVDGMPFIRGYQPKRGKTITGWTP